VQDILGESLSIGVRNIREAIAPAIETAEAWLEKNHAPPKVTYFVVLAIEELVINCIDYGYSDDQEHTIRITLTAADGLLTMHVVDDGGAFDPLAMPAPDLSLQVEDRGVGGLGIHLLRSLADHMAYERSDGTNRVTLVKKLQ
jgi:anti-sigma regulatory factor (Ser/Thr protein kinase)